MTPCSKHPVFDRGESAMFIATISESDVNRILAYNIPAVSSATGGDKAFPFRLYNFLHAGIAFWNRL